MRKLLCAMICFFSVGSVWAHGVEEPTQESECVYDPECTCENEDELKYLNRQIESLTNLKNYYAAKAVRFRNKGIRMQYQKFI